MCICFQLKPTGFNQKKKNSREALTTDYITNGNRLSKNLLSSRSRKTNLIFVKNAIVKNGEKLKKNAYENQLYAETIGKYSTNQMANLLLPIFCRQFLTTTGVFKGFFDDNFVEDNKLISLFITHHKLPGSGQRIYNE